MSNSVEIVNTWLKKGDQASDMGRHKEALNCYRQAEAIVGRSPLILVRIGTSFFDLGMYGEAVEYFRAAANERPDVARYWHSLGVALSRSGKQDEAENAWRRAALSKEASFKSLIEIAKKRENESSLWEAESCFRQALVIEPDSRECMLGLARVKLHQGYPGDALRWIGRLLARQPKDAAEIYSSFLVTAHYHPKINRRGYFTLATRAAFFFNQAETWRFPLKTSFKRLRIGYISPRLNDSPTGNMLLALVQHHDISRFEVFVYSTFYRPDKVAGQLKDAVEHWRDASKMDDSALAEQIRADCIDLLVDLAGHCPGGRTRVMCKRVAPVQLSWLDYFDTMGLSCYDGIISDPVSSPPEEDRYYSEQVLRVAPCRFVFRPPTDRPAVTGLSASRERIAFGCFNRMSKINDTVLSTWARILESIPGAVLILKNSSLNFPEELDSHALRLASFGISPERIKLLPYSNLDDLWSAYGAIDISLDPFPFNGGISTFDSLSMGVPVISLKGEGMVSRQSESILSACGLQQWVAANIDEYVSLAVEWSKRLDELAGIRAGLRNRIEQSPLCNQAGFAHKIEEVYAKRVESWRYTRQMEIETHDLG